MHRNINRSAKQQANSDRKQPRPGPIESELMEQTPALGSTLSPADIHHLQRTIGNQAVMRLLNRDAGADAIQRAPVETTFGTYTDEIYEDVKEDDGVIGVSMKLTFTPNEKVSATKIGMTQAVKSVKGGAPHVLDPSQKDRMTDEGFKTDRITGDNNPIYGSPVAEKGADLSDTPITDDPLKPVGDAPDDALYQLGFHYVDGKTVKSQDAEMHDRPKLRQPPPNSGQEFETTALAIEGDQKDTYYGSVRWGWESNDKGEFKRLELEKISDTDPSKNFIEAAKLWNEFQIDAKLNKPDEKGDTTVKEDVQVELQGEKITLAAGTPLNIDVSAKPVGEQVMFSLKDTLQLKDSYFGFAWIEQDKLEGNTLKEDVTVETTDSEPDKKKKYTIKAGAKCETGGVVGNKIIITKFISATLSSYEGPQYAWITRLDAFGRETVDLPIPGEKGGK